MFSFSFLRSFVFLCSPLFLSLSCFCVMLSFDFGDVVGQFRGLVYVSASEKIILTSMYFSWVKSSLLIGPVGPPISHNFVNFIKKKDKK